METANEGFAYELFKGHEVSTVCCVHVAPMVQGNKVQGVHDLILELCRASVPQGLETAGRCQHKRSRRVERSRLREVEGPSPWRPFCVRDEVLMVRRKAVRNPLFKQCRVCHVLQRLRKYLEGCC